LTSALEKSTGSTATSSSVGLGMVREVLGIVLRISIGLTY